MSTSIWRTSWHRIIPQNRMAVKQSIPIIRKIIATEQFRSSGLTTAEMFRLAVKEPPPPNFESFEVPSETEIQFTKSRQRKSPPPPPPHPEHPIRSIAFLKKQVLPILEGMKEIRVATGTRSTTVPEAVVQVAKSKGKGKALSASPSVSPASVSHNVRLWMPAFKPGAAKILPPPSIPGVEVGLGEDWDHLSKRRRRVRDEKVRHDFGVMVQRRKAENQERKRLAWESHERSLAKRRERYQMWQQKKAQASEQAQIN